MPSEAVRSAADSDEGCYEVRRFGIDKKYEKIAGLILAYVWNLGKPEEAVTHALSYAEAVEVAKSMGYTETDTWKQKGQYVTNQPSKRLLELLKPYRNRLWRDLIVGSEAGPNKPLLQPSGSANSEHLYSNKS